MPLNNISEKKYFGEVNISPIDEWLISNSIVEFDCVNK